MLKKLLAAEIAGFSVALLLVCTGFSIALLLGCTAGGTPVTPPATDPTTTPAVPSNVDQLGPPIGPVINHAVDPSCGTELWALKTLQDPGSADISITPVDASGIAELNTVSDRGAGTDTRVGIEQHVYTLHVTLLRAKIEADSDIHLVIADNAGMTMIAEFPAPQCVQDAAPAARQEIDQARQSFYQACGANLTAGRFDQLSGQATVTGVGLYDPAHGQSGRDDLGDGFTAELHPVIGFNGSCAGQALGHAHGTD